MCEPDAFRSSARTLFIEMQLADELRGRSLRMAVRVRVPDAFCPQATRYSLMTRLATERPVWASRASTNVPSLPRLVTFNLPPRTSTTARCMYFECDTPSPWNMISHRSGLLLVAGVACRRASTVHLTQLLPRSNSHKDRIAWDQPQ
jgi:hypothetical protein